MQKNRLGNFPTRFIIEPSFFVPVKLSIEWLTSKNTRR